MSIDVSSQDEAWTTESGLVTLYAPTGTSRYYRLEWYLAEGGVRRRKQTTAERCYEKAWEKPVAKDREICSGATPKTELPCSVGIAYWLSHSRPKAKDRGWGISQQRMMERFADDYFTPAIGGLRHLDLTW